MFPRLVREDPSIVRERASKRTNRIACRLLSCRRFQCLSKLASWGGEQLPQGGDGKRGGKLPSRGGGTPSWEGGRGAPPPHGREERAPHPLMGGREGPPPSLRHASWAPLPPALMGVCPLSCSLPLEEIPHGTGGGDLWQALVLTGQKKVKNEQKIYETKRE